jgi:hypothetical protein
MDRSASDTLKRGQPCFRIAAYGLFRFVQEVERDYYVSKTFGYGFTCCRICFV